MFSKILPVEELNKVRMGSSPGFSTWHHVTMVRTLSRVQRGAMGGAVLLCAERFPCEDRRHRRFVTEKRGVR